MFRYNCDKTGHKARAREGYLPVVQGNRAFCKEVRTEAPRNSRQKPLKQVKNLDDKSDFSLAHDKLRKN